MSREFEVRFPTSPHAAVRLPAGAALAERLDITNSPLLFGCRTGICGTCLVEVVAVEGGTLADAEAPEREILAVMAGDRPRVRLACQVRVSAHLSLAPAEG